MTSVLEYVSDFVRSLLATVLVAKSFDFDALVLVANAFDVVLDTDCDVLTPADCCSAKLLLFDWVAPNDLLAAVLLEKFADCDALVDRLPVEL